MLVSFVGLETDSFEIYEQLVQEKDLELSAPTTAEAIHLNNSSSTWSPKDQRNTDCILKRYTSDGSGNTRNSGFGSAIDQ